ncbi:UNVERIFIED_CONTAM: hypothetical protein Sangu_0476900 [Sesamum angustifolium]|uniref:Uncharacterized protein n=1 Tax=Sesamum angustifolium TaxID=2727405 RepID=A0AAW2Q7N2_9LAMI
MSVQYEATNDKSVSSVLVGEASTTEAKDKGTGCWRRKNGKTKSATASAESALVSNWAWGKGRGRRFNSHGLQKMYSLIAVKRGT